MKSVHLVIVEWFPGEKRFFTNSLRSKMARFVLFHILARLAMYKERNSDIWYI